VAPLTAHLHIVDAEGVDGEGLQIGEGNIDFAMVAEVLDRLAPHASFIPEIWQGHKNDGAGFWEALTKLEKWFLSMSPQDIARYEAKRVGELETIWTYCRSILMDVGHRAIRQRQRGAQAGFQGLRPGGMVAAARSRQLAARRQPRRLCGACVARKVNAPA